MLENIAIQYVSQTEGDARLIKYAITIVGAVLAAITYKNATELRRAPYFVYSGLLFFITVATGLVWFGSIPAMTGGFLWAFMLVDVMVGVAVGYAYGACAMARSRDAYGHARMGVLAFVPLANFWLLLTPTKNELSANRALTIPLLTGGLGVLTGFVLYIGGVVLATFIQVEMDRMVAEVESNPAMQEAGIGMMLRDQGLETVLREMAAGVPNQRIDEMTMLLRVESDGKTLRYIYELSTNTESLPESMRSGLVRHNCTYQAMSPIIEAGAIIEHVYSRPDGSEIGIVTVSRDLCGS